MAGTAGIITGIAVCNSGVFFMARVLGNKAVPITAASMTAVVYTVRDLGSPLAAPSTIASGVNVAPVSSVIFDNLVQTDERWDKDSANQPGKDRRFGYNFGAWLSGSLFVNFDMDPQTEQPIPHRYQTEWKFTPADSTPAFTVPYQFTPIPTWGP